MELSFSLRRLQLASSAQSHFFLLFGRLLMLSTVTLPLSESLNDLPTAACSCPFLVMDVIVSSSSNSSNLNFFFLEGQLYINGALAPLQPVHVLEN